MKQKKNKKPWWWNTAVHCWRVYFAMQRDGVGEWSEVPLPKQRMYALCNHLYLKKFVKTDQDILQMYFTTEWGDDQYIVEDYSVRNDTPTSVIWIVITRACRMIMEDIGLLEKKAGGNDNE